MSESGSLKRRALAKTRCTSRSNWASTSYLPFLSFCCTRALRKKKKKKKKNEAAQEGDPGQRTLMVPKSMGSLMMSK
jgi:hypothetical protein